METNILKIKVQDILGKQYAPEISKYLEEKNIKNKHGKAYSYASISHAVNTRSNDELLLAIVELLDLKIKAKQKLAKKIETI
jgi:hypothetical protein